MKLSKTAGGLLLGAGVGIAASAANAAAAPAGLLSDLVAEAGPQWLLAAGAAGVVANAGWVWAGAAMAAGRLAGTRLAGAATGALALASATVAYYGMDAVLRQAPLMALWHEVRFWWAAKLVLGLVLGALGSRIGRPGLTGLMAGLMVPLGAAVEGALLPRYPAGSGAGAALDWARLATWAAAAAAAFVIIVQAAVVRRRLRPGHRCIPSGRCC